MSPRLALPLLALSGLFSFVAAAATPVPARLAGFQQQLAETLEANDIPGAGIALVQDGEVLWAGGIGRASLKPEQHAISATRFRIGSITKMFTAIAVMQLVEQGRLSLDTPVRDIAPDVPIQNPWRESHPVTVAQLLEHTAGFDDMHFRNINTDNPLPDSLAAVVQRLGDELVVRWRPGVKHSYSNPGYAVAGYLVEKITGQPFHAYVNDAVLRPLGIERAAWGVPEDGYFAQGYTLTGGGELAAVEPRGILLYPAGELSMSSADLARVVRFFLGRGAVDGTRLLSEASIRRMETPATTRAAAHGLEAGYGLGNLTSIRQGFRLHGHNGGLDGFTGVLAYSPDHGFGYVILLNRADGAALRVLEAQATAFLAQEIDAPEPGMFDAAAASLPAAIEGCYRMSNSRNELLRGLEWLVQVACIDKANGDAVVRHPVLPQVARLVPVRDALLRESGSAWPSAVFMSGGELDDALQWSEIYFERATNVSVVLPLIIAMAAILLMVSSLLFAPVWMFRWWRGDLRDSPALSTRAWPVIAVMLFAFALFMATRLELPLLDSVNPVTLSVFLGGIAFAIVSLFSLYRVIRTWRAGIHPVAKWHTLLVSLACVGVALYLAWWRLVPLRLWAW